MWSMRGANARQSASSREPDVAQSRHFQTKASSGRFVRGPALAVTAASDSSVARRSHKLWSKGVAKRSDAESVSISCRSSESPSARCFATPARDAASNRSLQSRCSRARTAHARSNSHDNRSQRCNDPCQARKRIRLTGGRTRNRLPPNPHGPFPSSHSGDWDKASHRPASHQWSSTTTRGPRLLTNTT